MPERVDIASLEAAIAAAESKPDQWPVAPAAGTWLKVTGLPDIALVYGAVRSLPGLIAELRAAQAIADDAAWVDVGSYCVVCREHEGWYELEEAHPQIDRAVAYLDSRGLLERQAGNARLVRLVEAGKVAG